MKILQVVYNLASGGAERFVVDLCNELSKNNEVYLLTINDDTMLNYSHYRSELSSNVTYQCLGCQKGISFKSIVKLYCAIKQIKPDIVHTHTSLINIYLPAILLRKAKYIHTIHSLANKANSSLSFIKMIDKKIFENLVQPVTISKICQSSYESFYNLQNAVLIKNGCPPKQKSGKFEEVRQEIEKYKQDEDRKVFIHVARFSEPKNQKLLFETFLQLRDKGYKFLLIILGANYEKSGYTHLNNSKDFKILGEKNNVGDYLACADYFILTSLWEGLPISLIEAMSMGCIPISTPAGGVVDVIEHKKNGYVTKSFNQDELYEYVSLATQGKCDIKKEDVIESFIKDFTMKICAENYFKLYNKVRNHNKI